MLAAPSECGTTPLHDAVQNGHLEVVKLLVQSGGKCEHYTMFVFVLCVGGEWCFCLFVCFISNLTKGPQSVDNTINHLFFLEVQEKFSLFDGTELFN